MSYSFVITVTNGKPAVDENSPVVAVPDGKFQVAGHIPAADGSDWQYESLSVTRFDDTGNQVSQSSASVKKN